MSNKNEIAVTLLKEASVMIPQCPSTVRLPNNGGTIATSALSDSALQDIAQAWSAEFIRKARDNQDRPGAIEPDNSNQQESISGTEA